jgi:hypothetical protein
VIRIDVLPNDVLLETFDFYVKEHWIFGSPHRLDLRLFCTPNTPSRDTLNVWPALPLIIYGSMDLTSGIDNIIIALGHSNRVCDVRLFESETGRGQLEKVLAAMQVPFLELTELWLESYDEMPPVIPDSFLGGSAPRLQPRFQRHSISGITKTAFVCYSSRQPQSLSYPSFRINLPEAMVALLSVLSSLERLYLQFQSSQSRPDLEIRRLPALKRVVILSLTRFYSQGVQLANI